MINRIMITTCCLLSLGQAVAAQSPQPAWKAETQDQLIRRPDTIAISWPNDTLTVALGKTGEGFDADEFAHDVVCSTLLTSGKPDTMNIEINIYLLSFDGTGWQEELLATSDCE